MNGEMAELGMVTRKLRAQGISSRDHVRSRVGGPCCAKPVGAMRLNTAWDQTSLNQLFGGERM